MDDPVSVLDTDVSVSPGLDGPESELVAAGGELSPPPNVCPSDVIIESVG